MTLPTALRWLLVLALALPVVQSVLVWVRAVLIAMQDAAGAQLVAHGCTLCQAAWAIALVGLVIVLGFHAMEGSGARKE